MEKKLGPLTNMDKESVTFYGNDNNFYNMSIAIFKETFEKLPDEKKETIFEVSVFHSFEALLKFLEYYSALKGNDGINRTEFQVLFGEEIVTVIITTGLLNYWNRITQVVDDDNLSYQEKIEKLDLIKLNLLQAKIFPTNNLLKNTFRCGTSSTALAPV